MAEVDAVTKNVSLGGLLLESTCWIPYRTPVEFTITVRGAPVGPAKLIGAGQVARVEPTETADKFAIAVACDHPISQLDPP